jgi:predicted nucleic acid-binding protein
MLCSVKPRNTRRGTDANILVCSVREDSPWHGAALACLRSLAEGGATGAIPWPCIHEFLAVVTHHWDHLKSMLATGKAVGPLVHDA